MKKSNNRILTVVGIVLIAGSCNAQMKSPPLEKVDRQPVVAGSFYPADKITLQKDIEAYFKTAPKVLHRQPLAIIVPHAGYVFSGTVAASSFKQIDRNKKFRHIFIIGSSHTMYFEGASVYSEGDYITPLGKVTVDTLAGWLDRKYSIINNKKGPHLKEHAIEVELPFLQVWLKQPFTIVPIIIGGESEATCRKLAQALAPFFTPENLFVISTDFSHYPSYDDAKISDSIMATAVLSNSPQKFLKTKAFDENKGTPDLVTAMCGWTSVLTLLNITEHRSDVSYRKIFAANSGDTKYGDKDRVVGYYAMAVVAKRDVDPPAEAQFKLSDDDKIQLLKIARKTILNYIKSRTIYKVDERSLSKNLTMKTGAFVTLKNNGDLRGCVGSFHEDQPLYLTVQSMAIAAATRDYRFSPVKEYEVPDIEIEISVLTPLKKINSIDEIQMGRDGIYIKKGNRSGTFLPQVAEETNWTKKEFLGHCAQDKAFIGWNGWKDADIYTYQALVFSEKEFSDQLKQAK